MQQNKNTSNFSEIEAFAKDPETLTSSLAQVVDKFKLKGHLSLFDGLKSKGLCISSIVGILTILPFYGISSVYALVKSGIKISDIGKKDVYYDVKNNEFIDWRRLLMLHAKRFTWLLLKNQGTIASGRWIFGYKLLVTGFWDGSSFISLDFSFHREKGTANEGLIKAYVAPLFQVLYKVR